ncbi:hypothetical protein D7Y23_01850 [Corallococcus sp. AB050B]|nr:hypothetical protein D7Y23_01850 [Corallococcus sp. AB050B]
MGRDMGWIPPMSKSPPPSSWVLSAFILWIPGSVHVFPLLGVYMLMFNKAYPYAMLAGFAVTGAVLGLIQSFMRGPRALLFTPASFLAGWAPLPLLMAVDCPFIVAGALTLLTSAGCMCLGQWALSSEAENPSSPGA